MWGKKCPLPKPEIMLQYKKDFFWGGGDEEKYIIPKECYQPPDKVNKHKKKDKIIVLEILNFIICEKFQ